MKNKTILDPGLKKLRLYFGGKSENAEDAADESIGYRFL